MPTPARTSVAEIVAAGRRILEADGLPGLTMQAVAARVGVRAPSLYKHVRDRDSLIGLVADDTLRDLRDRLDRAGGGLADLARAFRAFAKDTPQAYQLLFALGPDASRPDPAALAAASEPVLRAAAQLVGDADALEAARTVTAWASGFVGMELAGAFRLGGNVDRAFDYGIGVLTRALTR
jgi:AcrR family transcriptional regulator